MIDGKVELPLGSQCSRQECSRNGPDSIPRAFFKRAFEGKHRQVSLNREVRDGPVLKAREREAVIQSPKCNLFLPSEGKSVLD